MRTINPVPENAKFLNKRQKHIAITRLREGRAAESLDHATVKQVLHMLLDWKLIVL